MKTAILLILVLAISVFAEATDKRKAKQDDYPLAIDIVGTSTVENAHDAVVVKGSDGNLYSIFCPDEPGWINDIHHCINITLVPGNVYRARWHKGNMEILVSEGSKAKEGTFVVIRSQKMTADQIQDCKVCVVTKEQ
jgi:hypothetical protein